MHKQVTVIEPGYGPETVQGLTQELSQFWEDYGLGNDFYYYKWYPDTHEAKYPVIAKYIKDSNITGSILLHYWW
jgi:hypothetical protein